MNEQALRLAVYPLHPDAILYQLKDLPTLSSVVIDLLNSIDHDEIDLNTLARKLSHDQSLTAKTLRFANSSFFGTHSKVTTVQQAMSVLGMHNVRHLMMATGLAGHFPDGNCTEFDVPVFWRHSVATAVCCKVLAMHLHLNQDYAFTAGLLHDIGRLVLVSAFPKEYGAVIAYRATVDCTLLDAERTLLGTDHAVVGHALAVQWQFSELIQKAIAGHHVPDMFGTASIASIVHVANSIVHALDLGGAADDLVSPVSQAAWDCLGLQESDYAKIFRETEMQFEAIRQVLH